MVEKLHVQQEVTNISPTEVPGTIKMIIIIVLLLNLMGISSAEYNTDANIPHYSAVQYIYFFTFTNISVSVP